MIANLIAGHWCEPYTPALPIYNPATEDVLDEVPLSGPTEVAQAVAAAAEAYTGWSQTPVMERTRLMFRYKALLEEHFEELAAIVTRHHGKTLEEARGEVRRGIEVVDFACGAPTLLQGRTLRQVSGGVDQDSVSLPPGSGSRDPALQLSGHDPAVDDATGSSGWEHLCPQAVGADTAGCCPTGRAFPGSGLSPRRAEYSPWSARDGGGAHCGAGGPGSLLRWLGAGCTPHLRGGRPAWEARASARRRQEPHRCHARR